jgi:hypothetical protein
MLQFSVVSFFVFIIPALEIALMILGIYVLMLLIIALKIYIKKNR